MLKQRIITALALLAVLLPALFADSPQPFLLLSILMIGAGAWEWGNMNGMSSRQAILSGVICVDLCVFAWWAGWTTSTDAWVWWMAGASWVGLTAWMLQRGVQGWALWHRDLRWLLGLFMLWLAWLAMAQARTASVQLLLSIFCVVWAADVFAYFCGKALGGRIIHRKLAPTVSPGKSWEGAIGGLLGVFVLAWVWMQLEQTYQWPGTSLFTHMMTHGVFLWALSLIFITTMSVVGDLVESLVKRSAGVKDSSNLLPGHGGVLDRLDALLPSLPIALMLLHWPTA
ncbi:MULTISPECIES: phosphatidate cytidylyltransferase [unclassified Limnohabitans]|jgi:phosphatidate cytidylyltransferase|uniref:phosphatidate cytidylyltransferase n=1 Tax=unclassified Limnohabitans TaxID=2626134 RepID=UPI0006DCC467|nr:MULTISPECIES: phosphatidate cytidylyltransferase [unclassified Limnohabitans]ALK92447.1 Phosphatidate cytidylyltransferase [Limnohabitans sp. 103DPR2]MBU3722888.1 phosphatidate cytidylyltransferase [Limnohabitans sp.]PUE36643.1 phosphatidate cytidylyltransferase [Limnohabitans sp. Hippo4]